MAAFEYSTRLPDQIKRGPFADRRRARIMRVAVRLPAPRPSVSIVPWDASDSMARRLGFAPPGRQFELPAFNERFIVVTEHERFAHDLLTPQVMEWLLADPVIGSWPLQIQGDFLLTWRNEPLTLDPLDNVFSALCRFLDQTPDHIWSPGTRP